jgi:predicted nicotinamide N-methyase
MQPAKLIYSLNRLIWNPAVAVALENWKNACRAQKKTVAITANRRNNLPG